MKKIFSVRYLALSVGFLSVTACFPGCDEDNSKLESRITTVGYRGVNSSAVDCHIYALPDGMSDTNRVNAGQTRGPLFTAPFDFSIVSTATVVFRASNPGGQLAQGSVLTSYSELRAGKAYRVEYDGTPNLKITEL